MDLAAHLGSGSLGALLKGTSSQELSLWMAKYKSDPWGEIRQDLRVAMLCSLIANCFKALNGKKGKGKWFEIDDFLLFKDEPTWEEKQEKLQRDLRRVLEQASARADLQEKREAAIDRKRRKKYGNNRQSSGKRDGSDEGATNRAS